MVKTDTTLGYCGAIEYQIYSITPQTSTASLITLFKSSTGALYMYFGPSVDFGDAKTFSIVIQAQFVGQTVWIGTSTTTFQYVDPCLTTTFTTYYYPALTQNLFVTPATRTVTQSLWIDDVSTSLSNLL